VSEERYAGIISIDVSLDKVEIKVSVYSQKDGKCIYTKTIKDSDVERIVIASKTVVPRGLTRASFTLVVPEFSGIVEKRGNSIVIE